MPNGRPYTLAYHVGQQQGWKWGPAWRIGPEGITAWGREFTAVGRSNDPRVVSRLRMECTWCKQLDLEGDHSLRSSAIMALEGCSRSNCPYVLPRR